MSGALLRCEQNPASRHQGCALHLQLSQVIGLEIRVKALGKERDMLVGQLRWCWHNPNNNNKKEAHFHQILHCTQKKTQSLLSEQSTARLFSGSHAGESSNAAVSSSFSLHPPEPFCSHPGPFQRGAQSQGHALSLSILLFS